MLIELLMFNKIGSSPVIIPQAETTFVFLLPAKSGRVAPLYRRKSTKAFHCL